MKHTITWGDLHYRGDLCIIH